MAVFTWLGYPVSLFYPAKRKEKPGKDKMVCCRKNYL